MTTAKMPKLLKKGNTYEFILAIKNFWTNFFRMSLFCSLFFNSIVTLPTVALWMIASQTQIFVMFNYFELNFPGNYNLYRSAFEDFLLIDKLDPLFDKYVKPHLGEIPDRTDQAQLKSYGLDTYLQQRGGTDIVENLGPTAAVILVISLIILIVSKCGRALVCVCCCCRSRVEKINQQIVYSSLLRILIETYMPVCLATALGLQNLYGVTWNDKACTVMSGFMLIYCLYLPV